MAVLKPFLDGSCLNNKKMAIEKQETVEKTLKMCGLIT